MKIVWTPRARRELTTQIRFIGEDSTYQAERVEAVVYQQVSLLARNPEIGLKRADGPVRDLALTPLPYIITYRIHDDSVIIQRVVHGAQRR